MGGIPPAEAPVVHIFSPSVVNLHLPYSDHEQKSSHLLYVGNLSPRVTEYMLTEIFAVAGPVQHVKIIPDRNYQHGGINYGFVEYVDMRAAEIALQTLNGRKIFDTEIYVNWAHPGQRQQYESHKEDNEFDSEAEEDSIQVYCSFCFIGNTCR